MIPAASLTLGPPGCGKTSKLVADVRDELRGGTSPDSIAIVTFTRAARDEVVEKLWDEFGLTEEDIPWLRTIHSTAYRLLGIQRDTVFTDKIWAEFAEHFGYDLTTAPSFDEYARGPAQLSSRTADDDLLLVREWGLNRRLPPGAALAKCPAVVPRRRFQLFCDRVENFKHERGLIEFADMLSRALELGTRPPVNVAFIDEAQDLSPAQVALAEMWFRDCARVEIAADDDQAVYGFSGADPSWLIAYSEQVPTRVLEQSRRVRSNVHEVANRIIRRNRTRAPKTWRPVDSGGSVTTADADDLASLVSDGRPSFVLVRNRQHIHALAKKLFDASVPYVVDGRGGPNPLGNPHLRIAIQTAQAIRRGSSVGAAELRVLMNFVPTACPEALIPVGAKTSREISRRTRCGPSSAGGTSSPRCDGMAPQA